MGLFLGTISAARLAPESVSYFATGMNGDEDLGQDIIMKGEKFHYVEKVPGKSLVQLADGGNTVPEKVSILEPEVFNNHSNGEYETET